MRAQWVEARWQGRTPRRQPARVPAARPCRFCGAWQPAGTGATLPACAQSDAQPPHPHPAPPRLAAASPGSGRRARARSGPPLCSACSASAPRSSTPPTAATPRPWSPTRSPAPRCPRWGAFEGVAARCCRLLLVAPPLPRVGCCHPSPLAPCPRHPPAPTLAGPQGGRRRGRRQRQRGGPGAAGPQGRLGRQAEREHGEALGAHAQAGAAGAALCAVGRVPAARRGHPAAPRPQAARRCGAWRCAALGWRAGAGEGAAAAAAAAGVLLLTAAWPGLA